MAARPLSGLKVLELARILAGPWAGQVLADLGADVLKVESPQGDDTRKWGPPFIRNDDGTQDAAYFHCCNRGKASRIIDFATEAGQAEVRALAAEADVVIENFKVGSLARYGLDFASLTAVNPRLVYCSITGFGQDGPYASRAGYDFIVQGLSGIMDLTGEPEGLPQKIGVAYGDILTGLYAVIGIQAALAHRDRTGKGQLVDLALFDVMVGTLANQAANYLVSGISPTRLGNRHPNIVPYEVFATSDGWFVLACGNDAQFSRTWALLGLEPDDRFATNAGRVEHRRLVSDAISAATMRWTRDDLVARLEEIGVPAGPINSVEEALRDPQIDARAMVALAARSSGAPVPALRIPIKFSEFETDVRGAAPLLGSSANIERSDPVVWRA